MRRRPRHWLPVRALATGALTLATLSTMAAAVVVGPPPAAAAGPAVVQSAGANGSNATTGSSVPITATLAQACSAGDTLVAFVTIAQQPSDAGAVAVTPPGWTRLYEHAPSFHVALYHGWFALSGCGGVTSATFTVSAPGNPDGTTGSVVLTEYNGLPSSPVAEFGTNNGFGGGDSSGSLTAGVSAPNGTVVLTAVSLYAPSMVSGTPSGWTEAGSEMAGSLPAWEYWQNGTGQDPSLSSSWSPASDGWEMSMIFLAAGPANAPPDVVQQASGAISSSTSWSVTLPQGVGTGDALVASILSDATRSGPGFEASTVTGGGVTWQQVTGFGASGQGVAEIWVGFSSSGTSGSTTVTANLRGSVDGQMVVSEVSDIDGIDTTSTTAGNSDLPIAASITPTAGDFMVAGMASPGSVLIGHPTPQWSTYSTSTSAAYAAEWWSDVPGATTTPQWQDSGAAPWTVVVAAFTAGTSPPPNTNPNAPPPTITAISPDSGSGSGGSTVTITGTDLTGATAVAFGANAGTHIAVNNAGTSLTVTTPARKVGTVDVSVTTADGTSGILPFTYVAYWMVGSDGGVFSFGGAPFFGSLPNDHVSVNDIVAIVPTHDGGGYWMIGSDGGVFAFGDAGFVGSIPGLPHAPHVSDIVGAVPTATGMGYWMVGSDGGVFAFGDATFVGSIPGLPHAPHVTNITAVVPTSTGNGYWMIGSDGGVFAFGDASFVGSIPGLPHAPHVSDIVGAVPTATGKGYWMVGSDGGVFAFGDATFVGSIPGLPGSPTVNDVVGVVATPDNQGYWMVGSDGGVFAFGDATFVGSIPGLHVSVHNIVGFAPQ